MGPDSAILLAVAGVASGLAGSIAGLASLFSYPALLAAGLPPVAANVTNTVALFANTAGTAAGSREELRGQRRRLVRLAILAAAGGSVGAALLLETPASAFSQVVPWGSPWDRSSSWYGNPCADWPRTTRSSPTAAPERRSPWPARSFWWVSTAATSAPRQAS